MLNVLAAIHGTGVAASTNSYESIATVTVGAGGSSSVSFSSIPSTYKHLQIRGILKNNFATSSGSDFGSIKFNNDATAANYNSHLLNGYGTGLGASAFGNSVKGAFVTLEERNANTSVFAAVIIDVLDYANTNKYKTVRSLTGSDNNSTGNINLQSGLWMSTSAVNRIDFVLALGTAWKEYSQFALYGIKG